MLPTEWDKLVDRLNRAMSEYYNYRSKALNIPEGVRTEFFAALDAVQEYRDRAQEARDVANKINSLIFR